MLLSNCGKTVAKQQTKVNALGAIVKLALVNGQARCLGERFWKTVIVKQIVQVITYSFAQCLQRCLMTGESVDLGQCFHNEAGVK